MPRPEKPIAPDAPFGAFALRLRALRRGAGNPTYRAMAARIGHSFSVSTLAGAASGDTMPNLDLTLAYAEACRGDRQYWTEQWFIARGADRLWPDEPWAATPPDPAPAADPAAYVALLRELRLWAGSPSLRVLARLTGHPRSSLGDACSPQRTTVPSEAMVLALVQGCLLHAYRNRPWLRTRAGGSPDAWIAGTAAAWLRTRHRLGLREAARARPRVRRHRTAAADGPFTHQAPVPRPAPVSHPAPDLLPAIPAPEPGAAGRAAAEAPGPTPEQAARAPRWGHLPADHPPEVRALATSLRALFDALDISVRRFAARHPYDAGTVSRYLTGRRIPPVDFVHTLVGDLAAHGRHLTPEAKQRLLAQHAEALRVVNPRAHRLAVLQERLREAEEEHLRLRQQAQILEETLRQAEARYEYLLRRASARAA
ncbi:hypothetical protein AB0953_33970 [Streptomyces sp. NPDC046866]|uniref:hypothetical protein n=1 Tax=Streptomyces sp. NPDC046866 TaxID=3154921 RepID=UPI0034519513